MAHPLAPVYWKNAFPGVVITAVAMALSFYSSKKLDRLKRERDSNGVFVVGTALTESNNLKGVLIVDYNYSFAGRVYTNSIPTDKWLNLGAGARLRRFYVRLALADPANAELLLDRPVPDNIVRSPDSGWVRMPQVMGDNSTR
jgi:hypothetical protein